MRDLVFDRHRWLLPLLGALHLACSRSAVPSLSADSLTRPQLAQLAPRALDVQVTDLRPVPDKDRRATERHLVEVLQQLLASSDVQVTSDVASQWFVTVQQPLSDTTLMDPSSCVDIQSELVVRGVRSQVTDTTSCKTWSSGGAQFGSGVLAFEDALNAVLARVDSQLANLLSRFAEPEFDAQRIRSPRFVWLRPRQVALVVKDELSAGGTSGASLERALGEAFRRSGVQITDGAHYEISWVLRRPLTSTDAEPVDACRQLVVTEKHANGRSSNATWGTCGTPSANDKLVSDVLEAIDRGGL